MKSKKKVLIFLDRDGVINDQGEGYANSVEDFKFIPGSIDAIKRLNKLGTVVVVTNQAGIGHGFMQEEDLLKIHEHMEKELKKNGAKIDKIYYCKYRNGPCRKPNPGMFVEAIRDFGMMEAEKFVVGDSISDLQAGKRVGCTTYLVQTGHGKMHYKLAKKEKVMDHFFKDLDAASKHIEKIARGI